MLDGGVKIIDTVSYLLHIGLILQNHFSSYNNNLYLFMKKYKKPCVKCMEITISTSLLSVSDPLLGYGGSNNDEGAPDTAE